PCGATVQQAFNTMYQLELSCRSQVDAMAARAELTMPGENVLAHTAHLYQPGTRRPYGGLEWPAMLRLLDAEDRNSGYPPYWNLKEGGSRATGKTVQCFPGRAARSKNQEIIGKRCISWPTSPSFSRSSTRRGQCGASSPTPYPMQSSIGSSRRDNARPMARMRNSGASSSSRTGP